ncbi:MAG TPA: 2-C-methyl-D-erythritol 2,4-cyclodiphosphate synthase [Chthonomonadaceae bacterium]|nr:2-C-methyl-D-erythritol 2,4-cyclodiphosphate synthase [Chthonomonadaceae bacterium]
MVCGGETRSDSVLRGLRALAADVDIVLVHDAARPLVTHALIDRIVEAAARTGGAVPGLPLSDTVKRAGADGIVRETVPRSATIGGEAIAVLTSVQTPQGARRSALDDAYARFDFAASEPTDEASLLEAAGTPVEIVPGDPTNIKITRQEDLALAERLLATDSVSLSAINADRADATPIAENPGTQRPEHLNARRPEHQTPNTEHPPRLPESRTGFGYDVHAFAAPEAGRALVLGGVEIPHDRGLEGHSDADVLLHAICDALLGTVSLGDIGILFPNTDEAYRGIASLRLLEECGRRVTEAGWRVVNIDATVVAEAPRLMPHRLAMQEAIAAALGIDAGRVSVKATTSERLGFVGRGEGMAAWAVATVRQLVAS